MVDYTALATEVMEHAIANYEEGGWDSIVECCTHAEIAAKLEEQKITTSRGAIKYYGEQARIWADYGDEIRGA